MHLWYNVVNLINVYSITEVINTLYPVDILINYHCSSLFIVIAHHLSLFIVEPFCHVLIATVRVFKDHTLVLNKYIYNIIHMFFCILSTTIGPVHELPLCWG